MSVRHVERRLSTSDFFFGDIIGEGSFSSVIHARRKDGVSTANNSDKAVKVMEKRHIMKQGKISNVMMEKRLLSLLDCNLIIKLYGSFQDRYSLYLVMDLCTGGELSQVIKGRNIITETCCC